MKTAKDIVKEIKKDVGDQAAVKAALGPQVERARLSLRKVFMEIQDRCNGRIVDENGDVVGSIDFADIFNAFTLEELASMQLAIAGNLSYLSFVLGNITLELGLDERTVKLAQSQAYKDTKALIELRKEKPTEKYIEAEINSQLYDLNVRIAQNGALLKYIETLYKAGELARNVLQAVINVKLKDAINDQQMTHNGAI